MVISDGIPSIALIRADSALLARSQSYFYVVAIFTTMIESSVA